MPDKVLTVEAGMGLNVVSGDKVDALFERGEGFQILRKEEGGPKSPSTNVNDEVLIRDCQKCGRKYKDALKFKRHMNHHTRKSVFRCDWPDCKRTFHGRFQLLDHRRVHTREKPFVCTEPSCSSSFTRKDALKRHMITHSGEKPFICEKQGCQKVFSLEGNLHRHEKKYHGFEVEFKLGVKEEPEDQARGKEEEEEDRQDLKTALTPE